MENGLGSKLSQAGQRLQLGRGWGWARAAAGCTVHPFGSWLMPAPPCPLAQERIIFIDGAMGTMIQRYKLQEEDFRGER